MGWSFWGVFIGCLAYSLIWSIIKDAINLCLFWYVSKLDINKIMICKVLYLKPTVVFFMIIAWWKCLISIFVRQCVLSYVFFVSASTTQLVSISYSINVLGSYVDGEPRPYLFRLLLFLISLLLYKVIKCGFLSLCSLNVFWFFDKAFVSNPSFWFYKKRKRS